MKTVMAYLGNHAEAIKVAPVAARLAKSSQLQVRTIAPHNQMAGSSAVAGIFGIHPEPVFPKRRRAPHPPAGFGQLLAEAGQLLAAKAPEALLVHASGRESSALAVAAGHLSIPLVSLDSSAAALPIKMRPAKQSPTWKTADLYLEANRAGYDRLRAEGIAEASVKLTGSTTIDSLLSGISAAQSGRPSAPAPLQRFLTGLRTPTLAVIQGAKDDPGVTGIISAMLASATKHPDRHYVLSSSAAMTNVRWRRAASALPNMVLCGSLEFPTYCRLLARSKVVLTDVVAVQAEAAVLGKTILLARSAKAAASGATRIVGVDPAKISTEIDLAFRLRSPSSQSEDPFSDGLASIRSAAAIMELLGITEPIQETAGSSGRDFLRLVPSPTTPEITVRAS